MKLLLLLVVFLISCSFVGVQAGKKPGIYKKWPACKKDYEYVFLVKNSDRIPGERYNERSNKNDKTLWYVCQPCTQCASGVRQLSPCLTHHDTNCSATQCTVAGCVLDDNFHACRLPGDPGKFPNISAMMDPCDPSKTPVDPATPIPPATEDLLNGPSLVQLKNSSASLSKNQKKASAADTQQNSDSNKSNSAETSGYKLGTLETVVPLTVSLIVVLIVLSVIVVYIYYRASRRRAPNGRGNSSSSERGVLETAV